MPRLERAELKTVGGPLPAATGNARQSWRERHGLLLSIVTDDGQVGQGEASPLPGYSPDSLSEARDALEAWTRGPLPELDESLPLREQIEAVLAGIEPSPAARFAVETALLDVFGRSTGQPVWRVLAEGHKPRPIPLCALISAREPLEALHEGHAARERGIHNLKVKIGRPGGLSRELELLAALRRELGEGVSLRLDANGSLPVEGLRQRLEALSRLAPELLEEPITGVRFARLESSPVPLAADESLQRPGAWSRLQPLVERDLLRAVVLKPMALGGSFRCLRLARAAAERRVASIVTHLFDGPVALAAASALALALPGEALACGLDRHPGLAVWPSVELPFLAASEIRPVEAAGLGLEVLAR